MNEYFYIITRQGSITEVPYSEEAYQATHGEWIKGGRLLVKPAGHEVPIGINTQDITHIFTKDAYRNYVYSSPNVKQYIRKGVWYDTKQHQEVRLENWVQEQRNARKALAEKPEQPPTPAMQKRIAAKRKDITKMLSKNAATNDKN